MARWGDGWIAALGSSPIYEWKKTLSVSDSNFQICFLSFLCSDVCDVLVSRFHKHDGNRVFCFLVYA